MFENRQKCLHFETEKKYLNFCLSHQNFVAIFKHYSAYNILGVPTSSEFKMESFGENLLKIRQIEVRSEIFS